MTRQTTTIHKPFLENGLINDEYLFDTRIYEAKIEGIDTWHLMELVAKVRLIDIGTQQARSIERKINELDMFNDTINLDEITVTDLIAKIDELNASGNSFDSDWNGFSKLQKILEQLKQLDHLGFVQIVTEKCLKRSIF